MERSVSSLTLRVIGMQPSEEGWALGVRAEMALVTVILRLFD